MSILSNRIFWDDGTVLMLTLSTVVVTSPHVAIEHLKFYFILIHLIWDLNSHMWLVDIILNKTVIGHDNNVSIFNERENKIK